MYAFYNVVGQPALFYDQSPTGSFSVLVDPNHISAKDKISLAGYEVSGDSRFLAYAFNRNGSDWLEIKVVNLKTGIHLKDHLTDVKFSSIEWRGDGFFYSKYPRQGLGPTSGQQVYYHKLKTDQEADELVFKRSGNTTTEIDFMTSYDESYFLLREDNEQKGFISYLMIDYQEENARIKPFIPRLGYKNYLDIIGYQDGLFYAISNKDNTTGMLVAIDPREPMLWKTIAPAFKHSLLLDVRLFDELILCVYQSQLKQQIVLMDYQGQIVHSIQIPVGISVNGFHGNRDDKKVLFTYQGFVYPTTVFELDLESFETKVLKPTQVGFDFNRFTTQETSYQAKDGTEIPIYLTYLKDLDKAQTHPTLLEAYGGFGLINTPSYDPGIVHFVNEGGIYAYACIRGGGEFGSAWSEAGRGLNKQTSFSDFIHAAEFLIQESYTSSEQLAISGASNGGLVVGAAMVQRPDLFKACVPVVGVLDMIRFENFTVGSFHKDEYGTVQDSLMFTKLLDYSPLHNIQEEVDYPATLIMTAENDDRVIPFHSYKFAARLQNRSAQNNPILLHVEKGAGHYGANQGYASQLQEMAAKYNFILDQLR
jgi:prolyl oligopeptidase